MFEKLTERSVEKRLSTSDLKNHPWLKGKIYSGPELTEEMRDRLLLYSNICKKEIEENKEKSKWSVYKPSLPMLETPIFYKHGDPFIQGCLSECAEINSYLEKQRSAKLAENVQENLSDDKVHSNSDENSDENEELEVGGAEDSKCALGEIEKR